MSHPLDRYSTFTDVAALKEWSMKPLRKSMRVNTLKSSVEEFKKWAADKNWMIEQVSWCPEGFFIDREDREEALGKDLLHLLGHTYMQEAASMLPVALLDPQPGEMVLDMSAAPGSKTTQIAARMNNKGVVIANDVQEKRLWTLKTALHRLGVTNMIVTKKVGQWFSKNMTERFDRVLCDAPCTAQGTLRKDSDALMYCSLENIGKMAKLQRELLESAVHAAKVGGLIVYSTCTLTPEENEEVVLSILNKFFDQLEVVDPREGVGRGEWDVGKAIDDSFKVQETLRPTPKPQPFLRLWPQTYDTEGFFCAILRKKAPTRHAVMSPPVRFQEDELPSARKKEFARVLEEIYGSSFLSDDDRLFQRNDQLLLATKDVAACRLPVQNYSLGLPFALRLEDDRLRLAHELVTLKGSSATKQTYSLTEKELNELLDGKDTTCDPALVGDIILRYQKLTIGIGLARDGKLKNRLPRWLVQKS